jgi:hypothetical protein
MPPHTNKKLIYTRGKNGKEYRLSFKRLSFEMNKDCTHGYNCEDEKCKYSHEYCVDRDRCKDIGCIYVHIVSEEVYNEKYNETPGELPFTKHDTTKTSIYHVNEENKTYRVCHGFCYISSPHNSSCKYEHLDCFIACDKSKCVNQNCTRSHEYCINTTCSNPICSGTHIIERKKFKGYKKQLAAHQHSVEKKTEVYNIHEFIDSGLKGTLDIANGTLDIANCDVKSSRTITK